jgi:nucleoside phosphorylase
MASSVSLDSRVDFVVVTALPEERDAVLDRLPGYRQLPPASDDIRTYFQSDLLVTFPDNSSGTYRIVVMCLLGMGRVQAVTAATDAIRRWRPRYILLIGIAGGIATQNVRIGDILISDQIVDYELQKITSRGPEIRWEIQRADPRLLDASNNYRGENWQELIQLKRPDGMKSKRHTGPIASGDKVIAFDKVLARYRDVWPKLIGVEMEAGGVATAAFQSTDRPGFFMVRGVSDLADKDKNSSDVEKWRSYACAAAASFAVALLKNGPVPLSGRLVQQQIQTSHSIPLTPIESSVTTKRVELVLEGRFAEFTPARQHDVVGVLATLLEISPSDIQVRQVLEGSIRIIIRVPASAADRLYETVIRRDSRFMELGIKSVLIEGKDIVEFTVMPLERSLYGRDSADEKLARLPYDHAKFVNRHEELQFIIDRVRRLASTGLERRVVVFRGARGSGKSWLLQEIEYQLRQNPANIPAVYVDLMKYSTQPVDASVRMALRQIDQEVTTRTGFNSLPSVGDLASQVGALVDNVRRLNKVLVLLFDYVDESSNDLLAKLEDHCLSPLAVEPQVFTLLAGRGKNYIWKGTELRLKSDERELPPFDPVQTLEQLRKQAPQAAHYADEIYELSGGNPWTNFLLRTLPASRADALHQTKEALLGSQTRVLTQPYLEALSVLGAFDENRMPAMFAAYFQLPAASWTYADCRDIRIQLTELRLARSTRGTGEYTLDRAIQPIVEKALFENDRAKWVALHCAAYCLYRDWAARYARTSTRWQAEADYHAQCLQTKGYAASNCNCQEGK